MFKRIKKLLQKKQRKLSFKGQSAQKISLIKKLDAMEEDNLVVIFYGSQTGTAEDLAKRTLMEIYSKLKIKGMVADLDDFDMSVEFSQWKNLKERNKNYVMGFVMATYGNGEPTDNATDFYLWLMDGYGFGKDKGNQVDHLVKKKVAQGIPYFVFGLGNKRYEQFCAIGRRISDRMKQCGGTELTQMGEGDANEGKTEEIYLKWKPLLLKGLESHFGLKSDVVSKKLAAHNPLFLYYPTNEVNIYKGELSAVTHRKWEAVTLKDQDSNLNKNDMELVRKAGQGHIFAEVDPVKPYDSKHPFYGRLMSSHQCFNNSKEIYGKIIIDRQCFQMEIDLANSDLIYETGDHVGIWAENSDTAVDLFAKQLGLINLDEIFTLSPNPSNPMSLLCEPHFPTPCTVRTALKSYLDINSLLKQHHFEIISKYASNPKERDWLWKLSEDKELFCSQVEKVKKTLRDICFEFPSVKVK